MVSVEQEEKISQYLYNQLNKMDLSLEVARFIFLNQTFQEPNSIQYWVVKQNAHSITEKTLEIDEFSEFEISVTFVSPNFFLDVFDGENIGEIPFWQIATVKRVLVNCKIIYDPDSFLQEMIFKSKTLEWSPKIINLKIDVSNHLIAKSNKFIEEDMLADAYMWGIKAVEEAICVQLMKNNSFNVTTPSLLLSALRDHPVLMMFYLDILGIEILTPDLSFVALKELENLADHIYHASVRTNREQWILSAFVSINEAERKLLRVINHASDENLDLMSWEYIFEDAVAELWQAFFITAQTPWNSAVPLDPWVVGLFWKWHVNQSPKYDVVEIIDRCKLILENGSPLFDWEE